MKIITNSPVMFNEEHLSSEDLYLSASGLDKNDVKNFQDWLDAKGIRFVGATNAKRDNGRALNKGTGYGNFGPSTTAAYGVYGLAYERSRWANDLKDSSIRAYYQSLPKGQTGGGVKPSPATPSSQSTPSAPSIPSTSSETSVDIPQEQSNQGLIGKFKSMSSTNKALIIGGVVLGVVLIAYFVKKARK